MVTEADGDIWRQREETVFQINDQYRRFWRRSDYDLGRKEGNGEEEEIAYFVPIMFDKANRTFNWVAAANPILEAATSGYENSSSTKYARDALPTVVKTLYSAFFKSGDEKNKSGDEKNIWQEFEDRYSDQPGAFKEYIEFIYETVKKYGRLSEDPSDSESLLSNGDVERFWTAILMAYSCYSHPSDQNFEGIFFRILEDVGHTCPEIITDAVFGVTRSEIVAGVATKVLDLTHWKNKRGSSFPECPLQEVDGRRTMSKPDKSGLRYSDSRIDEAPILQKAFLCPLLMDWDSGKGKTLTDVTESHNFILLVPIYDVWSGPQGWGGLKAVLVIFLKPSELEGDGKINNLAWQGNYEKMLERCGEFAQEIGQAATRRALSRPIVPPYDLVRQFLRILIEVQDWEEAVVFYDNDKNNEKTPHYSFKRVPHDNPDKDHKGVRKRWKEEEWKESGAEQQSSQPSNELSVERNEFYMWWTSESDRGCQDLWSQAVLPGLSPEERAKAGGISIRFKFSKAYRIPPDPKTRQFLVEAYRRQQLELMRGLIPKVRARRAALRNTVSAVMGRNMSHNIGSHVLARYGAEVTQDARARMTAIATGQPPADGAVAAARAITDKLDPAADFLGYLQKRMDFLADVGTNDKAYWVQSFAIGTLLSRFDYGHEASRLAGKPPLLEYITGKDGLKAHVNVDKAARQLLFSCPGGEVGAHALYIILENVIRNSARHNSDAGGCVTIKVTADPAENGLIKLYIHDLRSRLRVDGAAHSTPGRPGPGWKPSMGSELQKKVEDARKKRKEASKAPAASPTPPEIVPDEINYIIECEPIIDDHGQPSPKYWGVREMHICAQYLRQLLLSNLEDVSWSDRDPEGKKRPVIQAECRLGADESHHLAYVIYLQEAKPVATVGTSNTEDSTVDEHHGWMKVELGRKAREQGAAADLALRLHNYAFLAYEKDGGAKDWVEKHKARLPVRQIALPTEDGSLTWSKLEGVLRNWPDSLPKVTEHLHEALAKQISRAQDFASPPQAEAFPLGAPAGLVLTGGGELQNKVRSECFSDAEKQAPLNWKRGDEYTWADWIDRVPAEGPDARRIDACVWVDHPTKDLLSEFHNQAGPKINGTFAAPIFSYSPETETLRGLDLGQGWELIVAALPRVAVLDERVQGARDNPVRKDLTAGHCWPGMRIMVPEKSEADLNVPNFTDCKNYLTSLPNPADYLIFHLTVLEHLHATRRRLGNDESPFATLDALTKDTKAMRAEVMIVTGRGVPTLARLNADAPVNGHRVRYLPISAILDYLTQHPSKLGLMRVLWGASSPMEKA